MSTSHVALFDASVGETPAERNFRRELDATVTAFKISENEFPEWPGADGSWAYDGVVISGSQTSVYEHEPWMETLAELVRDLHELGVPMLGVCWGHQFLAQALGGCVADMGEYELGYRRIERYDESPLFEGMPAEFVAFETHSDEVLRLPPGGSELAGNERSCQAFAVGMTFGVQFHPEYDLETARMVTERKREEGVPDERIDAVLADATPDRYAEAAAATDVFDNFLAVVERTRGQGIATVED
ncbi:type 1 glutamine amidotransferase [Halobellus ordinarius]|uniref:type 1 glutamine amidotransferase n=1 Tax=Halobellus ordinarius TaxID=3075120 RepID=UPI0028803840|nr:type 1 glutamine amidotransferase [Halobellus sp. ZY16]